ncbi:MAG: prenyltransferase/squalene oxidase repeat-containing protein [Planctomycetota bacterium]
MRSPYLQRLDGRLASGAALLGERFARGRAEYVRSKQMPAGGFPGRRGAADIYYTDFALRTLALLAPDDESIAATAAWVEQPHGEPKTVAECFNRLNCARMLASAGIEININTEPIAVRLAAAGAGAYDAFLAALCHEMLGTEFPRRPEAAAGLSAMLAAGHGELQTNDAAAAVSFLMMNDALGEALARAAAAFIVRTQAPGGGFRAHPAAPEPDLLSTFTALVTLDALGVLDRADLAAAGRFVRSLAAPDGGFRSCDSDDETDLEYTYYGVAGAALLKLHVAERGR